MCSGRIALSDYKINREINNKNEKEKTEKGDFKL